MRLWRITGLAGTLQPEMEFNDSDPNGRKEAEESPFAKAMMKLPEEEMQERIMQLVPTVISNEHHRLHYLGKACQAWLSMNLPKDGNCRVEVIDTWEMTRDVVMERAHGRVRVELPGKEGMAVLVSKL
ncbi:MAG: DUF5605 domain-containing protein [Ruminococcus sp.]|nr:DUF5605 domain-containing protein [Ruminococcus sp.]